MRLLRSELRRDFFGSVTDVSPWTLGRAEAALLVLDPEIWPAFCQIERAEQKARGVKASARERLIEACDRSLRRRLVLLPANRPGWGLPHYGARWGLCRGSGVGGQPAGVEDGR